MARKATGVPKEKQPKTLNIAEHLPRDSAELHHHVDAGWAAMKADTTHFPSPPATASGKTRVTISGLTPRRRGTWP